MTYQELKHGDLIKAGQRYYRVSITIKNSGGGNTKYEKAALKKLSYEELYNLNIQKEIQDE